MERKTKHRIRFSIRIDFLSALSQLNSGRNKGNRSRYREGCREGCIVDVIVVCVRFSLVWFGCMPRKDKAGC